MTSSGVSAIIPTYNRPDKLRVSLERILACEPPPAEVIVHADGGDNQTATLIRAGFPQVRLIESVDRVGPGGGRNRLLAAAACRFVASFDDDSYPVDTDYFARLELAFEKSPETAVLAAAIFHNGEQVEPDDRRCRWVADFVGCGCAYRREAFMRTTGFVPLPLAYGMEEVDLALRLHGSGWRILQSPWLRVRHETDRQHQADPAITSATVANLPLLTYLRYPVACWWVGLAQTMSRVCWLALHRRWRGITGGFYRVPGLIRSYAGYRRTVSMSALNSYLRLRRRPVDCGNISSSG
jgi:GT2 family glycosyltransferase